MTGVESLFSEKSEMFSVSDAQTKPDKSMNDKEWDDYLNKIDNVLVFINRLLSKTVKRISKQLIKSGKKTGQYGLKIFQNLCRWDRHLWQRR